MLDEVVENMAIEQLCKKEFAFTISLKRVIARDVPTSKGTSTTVFEDTRRALYALCIAEASLTLGDVKAIVRHMGMEADTYFAPHGQSNYFLHYGRQNFYATFPGRKLISDEETDFYQSLAPYNPALMRIARVKGEIREYSSIFQRWQKTRNYNYTRMQIHS